LKCHVYYHCWTLLLFVFAVWVMMKLNMLPNPSSCEWEPRILFKFTVPLAIANRNISRVLHGAVSFWLMKRILQHCHVDLCLTIDHAMYFMFCSFIHQTSTIHFLLILIPKIMKLFAWWSQECLVFY
jgi:hypothetical protein